MSFPQSNDIPAIEPWAHCVNVLGGALANPAEQYSAFRNVAFFQNYPYALPGFVSGAFCLSTAIVSLIFLDEVSLFVFLSIGITSDNR